MKLGIPPVVVLFITAFLMWLTNWSMKGMLSLQFDGQRHLSLLFFLLCMFSVLSGIYAFARHKTTVDPMNPEKAESLVTKGVYGFTRNPMYLGMVFLLLGWGTKLGNPVNLIFLILFLSFMTEFQIKPEEEALRSNFGATFDDYCKRVRRWL